MFKNKLIVMSVFTLVTALFVLAYIGFSLLDIASSDVKRYALTITTDSASKTYDGSPLMHDAWHIISGRLEEGHRLETEMPAQLLYPGNTPNEIGVTIYDAEDRNITSNYRIELEIGTLTVHPRPVTIETASANKTYDGTALTNSQWRLNAGSLLNDHHFDVEMDAQITNPGSIENAIHVRIINDDGADMTEHYQITYDMGELRVNQRNLTVTTKGASKFYDGTPLSEDTWWVETGTLVLTHRIEAVMAAQLTEPGTKLNRIGMTILDDADQDVTAFYHIEYDEGLLEVKRRDLIIQTESASRDYNGFALTKAAWHLYQGTLLDHHHIDAVMTASLTEPGRIDNSIGITIYDDDNQDKTAFYNVLFDLGSLTIYGHPLTIRTGSASRMYDGSPLSNSDWHIFTGEVRPGHRLETVMTSYQTVPGSSLNEIGVTIFDETDQDVTRFYDVYIEAGTLTVEPISITLRSESANKVYDGTPLSKDVWHLVHGNVLAHHTLHVIVDGEIVDVGQIYNNLFAYVVDENNQDVSHYYDFNYFKGTLTIFSSVYAANELAREGVEIPEQEVFRFLSTDDAPVYFRGHSMGNYHGLGWHHASVHPLNLTLSPLSFSAQAYHASGALSHQIQLEYLRGQVPYLLPYFTIDALNSTHDIYLEKDQTGTLSFNYIPYLYDPNDSIEHQDETISADELAYRAFVYDYYLSLPESTRLAMLLLADLNGLEADSPMLVAEVQQYIRQAATYNLNFEPIPDDVEDIALYFLTVSREGICQHYATAATLMYRALGIPARYVTGYLGMPVVDEWTIVTAEYAHAWVEVYIDGLGWIPVEVTGGGIAGPGPNEGDDNGDPGDDNGDNGDDNGEPGDDNGEPSDDDPHEPITTELIAKPHAVIEPFVEGAVIRAETLDLQGFDIYADQGYTYEVIFIGELSTPGKTQSTIASLQIFDATGTDVTETFSITYRAGKLQLYLYVITVSTEDEHKTYDGSIHTGQTWDIEGSLGDGHYVIETVFNRALQDVGARTNAVQVVIFDQDGLDVTGQYKISDDFGDLIVEPRALTIVVGSDDKQFDGLPLVYSEYELLGDLVAGHTLELIVMGSQTQIGRSVNTATEIRILDGEDDVTRNYSIVVIDGTLTVRP